MWHTEWHVAPRQANRAVFKKSYELAQKWNMKLKIELSLSQNKDKKKKKKSYKEIVSKRVTKSTELINKYL